MDAALSDEFRRARGEDGHDPALEPLLQARLSAARERWPKVRLDPKTFARGLGARARREGPAADALAAMQAEDLFLALACERGDSEAISALSRMIEQDLAKVLASRPALKGQTQDLRQSALERFLVAGADGRVRIAEYAGTGSLRGWLRVALTRLVLDAGSRPERERPASDEALLELAGAAGDLELDALTTDQREAVQEAIAGALAELEPRDRAMLKQRFLQQSTVEEIAALNGVHRVTATRQLGRARAQLEERVQARLREALGVSEGELRSVLRGVHSRLDLHLSSVFRTRPGT